MSRQFWQPTDEDREWLSENQPRLVIHGQMIEGTLQVNAEQGDKSPDDILIYHSALPQNPGQSHIDDDYKVQIEMKLNNSSLIPTVRETEGKIKHQLLKLGLAMEDIKKWNAHIGEKGYACLATDSQIQNRLSADSPVSSVLNEIVIPFFYYQSYWAKFGVEPWEGLKHGAAGIFQDYYQSRNKHSDIMHYLRELFRVELDACICVIYGKKIPSLNGCCCSDRLRKCNCGAMDGYNLMRDRVSCMILTQNRKDPLLSAHILMQYVRNRRSF